VPDHHQVRIYDCSIKGVFADSKELLHEIEDLRPDIVGVSASMQTYHEAVRIIRVVKSIDPGITTTMGGAHPSIFSEKVMENEDLDFVFRGEAELMFPHFLEQLKGEENFENIKGLGYRKDGRVVLNDINLEADIDSIKIPDYKNINLREYIKNGYSYGGFYGKSAPVWITRGCPYGCSFCSASLINGKKIRRHSVEYVVNWIDHLYREFSIRQFALVDDNFTFQIDYAKKFCRTIIELVEKGHFKEKIYFATPNGVRIDSLDDELITLMKKAGWQGLSIAPESGSRKTLKRMRKTLDPASVPGVVERIKKQGLDVRAFFIIGYPGETRDDVRETVTLIRRSKIDAIILGKFLPIPGTPIFNELVSQGEISADYMPQSIFKFVMPLSKNKEDYIYSPKGLEDLNTFAIFLRESILLAIRNPNSVAFYFKYYGFFNLLKKLLQAMKILK
jgi:radical SAM superfamily enzyme YgiQ (UPF0313 family)